MNDTATQEQVLQDIDAAWRQYHERVTSLSEDELLEFTDDRGWSVRDHIDHVTAWEASITVALQGRPRHEGLRVAAEDYGIDIDELNEKVRASNAGASLEEVLEESERGHHAFLAAIRALPADGLDRPYGSYQPSATIGREKPIVHLVLANSVEHYPEHLAYIEEILARA